MSPLEPFPPRLWQLISRRRILVLGLLCLVAVPIRAQTTSSAHTVIELGAVGAQLVSRMDSTRLVETVRTLSSYPARDIGSPGNVAAAAWIADEFARIGLKDVQRQGMSAPIPLQEYAYALLPLETGGYDTIRLQSYRPNFARTNTTFPEGIRGHLVHVEHGYEHEYNGQVMDGSILLAEMTASTQWRIAATLGARAAIFLEPRDSLYRANPFFATSVNFPRFRAPLPEADRLRAWAIAHPNTDIILKARQPWTSVSGTNITGFLPGSDPVLRNEVIIVTAPFDATSPLQGVSPGAEAALGIAAELELARLLAADPPPRSVLFVALDGQESATMLGGRMAVVALRQSYPASLRRNISFVRHDVRLMSDPKLSRKFPAFRAEAQALDERINRLLATDVARTQVLWDRLQEAREAYRTEAAPTKDRQDAVLAAARERRAQDLAAAADAFIPAFQRASDDVVPLIAELGRLHGVFVELLERDRAALEPGVAADEGKIRTSLAGRLAAARLGDVKKALRKLGQIDVRDHERQRQELADQFSLVRPVLGRYPALLVDLSLSSHSNDIGLFYTGHFYVQQPDLELKRLYGGLGKRLATYANGLMVVTDLAHLWSLPDDSVRSLIQSKIAAISRQAAVYRRINHVVGSDVEVIVSYAWYHRVYNATGWMWGLVLLAVGAWLLIRWQTREESRPPYWYWLLAGVGALLFLLGLFGSDWKHTTRIYHGIDRAMWDYPDALINAQLISREDQMKIRRAADKRRRYTEITETPEFFAENVLSAIPATIRKLQNDSVDIGKQFALFDRIIKLRNVPPVSLTQTQLDTLNLFMKFLGLKGDEHFVDAVAGTPGKSWAQFLPRAHYFTSEIATMAGMPAIALSTLDDLAPKLGSEYDELRFVNLRGVFTQARTLFALIAQALADPTLPDDLELGNHLAEVHGVVLYDDRQSGVTPDVPVPGAIILGARWQGNFAALTDGRGAFHLYGLPMDDRVITGWADKQWLHAYKTSPDSGNIHFAIDLGNEQYAFEPKITQLSQDWMLVVFPCASVSVTNIVDPRYFQYLARADVYDAHTDAKPWHFFTHVFSGDNTCFVDPNTRVKLVFAQGLLGVRAMMTGVPDTIRYPEQRQGIGFPVVAETLLTHATYQAARDMWQLNDARMATLVRHGIIDNETRAVHDSAAVHLEAARQALGRREYDAYLSEARTALALDSRVLPDVLSTASGALKGVLFYMALLLPFAFFLERLIIGAPDVRKQALWFFAIFILMFLLIEQVHPAFDITTAPPMVLLAFTVFALSIFVITIIIGKFSAQMQQIRKEQQGYLSADVGRLSAMFTAFLLGVSNMRRRKLRTSLTCTTLIILTFTVLSFTSVREFLRVNHIRLDTRPPAYSGVLIRDRYWDFWPWETLWSIQSELRGKSLVVGRVWREAYISGTDFYFTLEAENGKKYTLSGFVGMEPEEDQVTGIFRRAGIRGRWFNDDDLYALVIPRTAARALDIDEARVTGDVTTAPKVRMEGIDYAIIGILDDELLRQVKDLDGEELTTVNWQLAEQQRMTRLQQQQQQRQGQKQRSSRDSYIHLTPAQCMFMPLKASQGSLVTVAIRTPTVAAARGLVERVIPKWALEMYVGQEGGTFLYSAVGLTTLGGLRDVLIPILIAALIVLNAMLGAVFERTREIGIFSSVGLAPSHIAMLFMAEATVYAVLGAIAGYLLGQTVGQAIYKSGILGGITLNYSSVSAVTSTLIVMVTVLLSTLYPAKKASELSVPDIARTWKLPEPSGEDWYFSLPFSLLDEELEGVNAFLAHYFESHHDESSNDFYIDRVDFWAEGGRFMLETMVWLAPYDLGVSELVTLITTPVPKEKGLFGMSLLVTRESGDMPSWTRVNRRFVNFLRKQFLVWRALTPAERRQFIARGRKMFSVDGKRAIEQTQPVETVVDQPTA